MPCFAVVIPVYNRPDEVDELLQSLVLQDYKDFEVIIVEDGSVQTCEAIANGYRKKLNIRYFFKENSGPGLSRNYGAERSEADFIVFFDSDCIIPPAYFSIVSKFLFENQVDAWGGPDREHPSFSNIQKAINYSMTSFFTTGGIRGGKKQLDKFLPRSFNMGFNRNVFKNTGGYSGMRFGEDLDLSLRIIQSGYKTALIRDAFVYHKRRTSFRKFFKQIYNSGIARINLYKLHPESLKLVHYIPAFFLVGIILLVLLTFTFGWIFILPVLLFMILVFTDSLVMNQDFYVALLSVVASLVQTTAYGAGFISAFWKRILLKKGHFDAFTRNFYK